MTEKEYNTCVARWADDVMRFAVSLRSGTDRQEDCEDAVQESYTALWRNRSKVGEEKAKSYLFTAVYRQMLYGQRRRHTFLNHSELITTSVETQAQPDVRFDIRDAIDEAMRNLSPSQRAILHLRDIEGYAYAEIAAMTGMSTNAVQVQLYRARVAMRKYLKTLGYGEN